MTDPTHEAEWANWMRLAISGDSIAYHRLLTAVTPRLRTVARRRCEMFGTPVSEAEDVLQEVLLAIHLKRGTWDQTRPLGPWLSAVVHNKLIDSLRRRGRQVSAPLEDVIATLESEERLHDGERLDLETILNSLKDPQRKIVRSISIEGSSVRETAEQLEMTEVAVRAYLHRALKILTGGGRESR